MSRKYLLLILLGPTLLGISLWVNRHVPVATHIYGEPLLAEELTSLPASSRLNRLALDVMRRKHLGKQVTPSGEAILSIHRLKPMIDVPQMTNPSPQTLTDVDSLAKAYNLVGLPALADCLSKFPRANPSEISSICKQFAKLADSDRTNQAISQFIVEHAEEALK